MFDEKNYQKSRNNAHDAIVNNQLLVRMEQTILVSAVKSSFPDNAESYKK